MNQRYFFGAISCLYGCVVLALIFLMVELIVDFIVLCIFGDSVLGINLFAHLGAIIASGVIMWAVAHLTSWSAKRMLGATN